MVRSAPHPGRRPGAGCACPQPRREIGCGRGCHGDGRTHGSQNERLDVSAQVHGSLAHQAVIGEARPQISHRRHYLGDVEMIHVGRKLLVERPDAQPGRHVGHGPPIAIQRNLQIGSKLEELVGRRLVERGEPSDEATSDSRLARVGTGQTARFQAVLRDKAPDNRGHEVVQQQVGSGIRQNPAEPADVASDDVVGVAASDDRRRECEKAGLKCGEKLICARVAEHRLADLAKFAESLCEADLQLAARRQDLRRNIHPVHVRRGLKKFRGESAELLQGAAPFRQGTDIHSEHRKRRVIQRRHQRENVLARAAAQRDDAPDHFGGGADEFDLVGVENRRPNELQVTSKRRAHTVGTRRGRDDEAKLWRRRHVGLPGRRAVRLLVLLLATAVRHAPQCPV